MNYESKGELKLLGCCAVRFVENFIALYPVGARVFIKSKAVIGKLEFVVIKKIRRLLPNNISSYGILPEVMYEDTLNRIWSEEELITESHANNLYESYLKEIRILKEKSCLPVKFAGCA